ncbi:hypothetical protein KFE25_002209 [Diacronema lutheri]|uniref:Trichohyalin-plectin-homology domain-containing protein n=1 Tax=Diacronema lutheri TaxID=2081491 RepID=A0A8J5XKL5_DIALT|nr:hypothetical protein KFE25_002209 [Diacronema lutheri]
MLPGAPEPTSETIFVDRYAEIAEYLKQEADAAEISRKQKLKEERHQQRLFLDEQVRLQKEHAAREKADEHKFVTFERERRERWNAIDATKRAEMKQAETVQKLARDAQVREVQARKDAARRVAEASERETLERIRDELRDERVQRLTRQLEESDNMARVVEQNERNLKLAAERRHQQFLNGQKVGIEYKKILDKQERDREDALASTQARMQRQAQNAANFFDAIAVEGAKDLAKAIARQDADAAARDAELAGRDERRRQLQRECNAILELQVQERRVAGRRHAAEERAIVQLEAEANARAAAAEREEDRRRRAFEASYRTELSTQVRTDRVRKQMLGYTLPTAEMQMNSQLLRKVAAAGLTDKRTTKATIAPPRALAD